MAEIIQAIKHNEVFDRIVCDDHIHAEIDDQFTFKTPGCAFHPLFKKKIWDGKIHVYKNKLLYCGLRHELEVFCKENNYELNFEFDIADKEFSVLEAKEFIDTLNIPFEVRDYQLKAFVKAVRSGRATILSPTGSGKSLIIYLLIRYYNKKTLLLIPSIGPILQMENDFISYGYTKPIHKIYSGKEKVSDADIIISTWNSLYKLPKDYFKQYECVIVDEVHGAEAKELKGLLEKCITIDTRFGFTGTLNEGKIHRLIIEGLFGKTIETEKTYKLIEQNYLSPLKIKCLVLKHNEENKKSVFMKEYRDEINFLYFLEKRNNFISNLALSLNSNTLVLYRYIDHGKILFNKIKEKRKNVYLIYGDTPAEDREKIRNIVSQQSDAILVASYGTFSASVNIPSISNIIFASPYKGKIKVLQSIGRGLRTAENKDKCILFDIADNMMYNSYINHTFRHYLIRTKLYKKEKFEYKAYKIFLGV